MFVPNKLIAINASVNKTIDFPNTADKTFNYITKVTGATIGAAGAAKGSVDLAEALACQDDIFAIVSGIEVAADGLQICASFIPGPNLTAIVRMPISFTCKVFLCCCKKSKLPWGSC